MSQQHLVDLVEGHMVVQREGEQGHLSLQPGNSLQWMVSLTDLSCCIHFPILEKCTANIFGVEETQEVCKFLLDYMA
jgi:hypothetical protein